MYARYAEPYCWIVDFPTKTIEAYQLTQALYRDAGALSAATMVSLPPFPDLILDPREIWPGHLTA